VVFISMKLNPITVLKEEKCCYLNKAV